MCFLILIRTFLRHSWRGVVACCSITSSVRGFHFRSRFRALPDSHVWVPYCFHVQRILSCSRSTHYPFAFFSQIQVWHKEKTNPILQPHHQQQWNWKSASSPCSSYHLSQMLEDAGEQVHTWMLSLNSSIVRPQVRTVLLLVTTSPKKRIRWSLRWTFLVSVPKMYPSYYRREARLWRWLALESIGSMVKWLLLNSIRCLPLILLS